MGFIGEFFGYGGYQRPAEGAYSWQHLLFVISATLVMIGLAVFFGLRNRHKDDKTKNKVIIWCACLIDGFELLKWIIFETRASSILVLRTCLPLFLCSIQLITLPVAAFSKGRIKEACLDFILMFGILGGVAGTIGAAQNYSCYPVLSFDNVVSAITHCISAFASLYIAISGMVSMKKKNIWITVTILLSFIAMAFGMNYVVDYNYMFLRNHDGTPYVIFYNMVHGNKVLYPMTVILVFLLYMALFYTIYYLISKKGKKEATA